MATMIQELWFARSAIILGLIQFYIKQCSLTCTNGNSNGCTSCDISSTHRVDKIFSTIDPQTCPC